MGLTMGQDDVWNADGGQELDAGSRCHQASSSSTSTSSTYGEGNELVAFGDLKFSRAVGEVCWKDFRISSLLLMMRHSSDIYTIGYCFQVGDSQGEYASTWYPFHAHLAFQQWCAAEDCMVCLPTVSVIEVVS